MNRPDCFPSRWRAANVPAALLAAGLLMQVVVTAGAVTPAAPGATLPPGPAAAPPVAARIAHADTLHG
jgi:hypothetical protein